MTSNFKVDTKNTRIAFNLLENVKIICSFPLLKRDIPDIRVVCKVFFLNTIKTTVEIGSFVVFVIKGNTRIKFLV